MDAPLIDIVIPNRNKIAFLPGTIESLQAQTEQRWRAIVIDGDSTDGSFEYLRTVAKADDRFVIRSARPASLTGLSLYRSWNQGLLFVRAPFYAVLTSDDLWEADWIRRAIQALELNPTAIASVARACVVDEQGVVGGLTLACTQFEASFPLTGSGVQLLSSDACLLRCLLLGPVFTTIHALVFRRSLLEDGGLFAEDVGYLADIEYYLNTCLHGDIAYHFDSKAFFRIYPTQASSEAKGPLVTQLWAKVVHRNRRLVAKKLGIPVEVISSMTDEILARHRFIMTKPDRITVRQSKVRAAWRMMQAALGSPALAVSYVRCRADRERFLGESANRLVRRLAIAHSIS